MSVHLEIQAAVAKIGKYATRESGDTVEIVERPHGGLSIVMADGQRSGRSAKLISNIVVRKALSLLAEGVRDGAVARATHDYLLTHRGGKVSSELLILSLDLMTQTMVISRNSRCPVWLRQGAQIQWLDSACEAIGIHRHTKPAITELPLTAGQMVVAFTDGVWSAGGAAGSPLQLADLLARLDDANQESAQAVADGVLDESLRLDKGRPKDDITVLVVKIVAQPTYSEIRRMSVTFPIG